MVEERVFLTLEEAIALLPENDEVHTFRNIGRALIGTDWDRKQLIEAMTKFEKTLELAGETATGMGHGLVVQDKNGPLFIQTKKV